MRSIIFLIVITLTLAVALSMCVQTEKVNPNLTTNKSVVKTPVKTPTPVTINKVNKTSSKTIKAAITNVTKPIGGECLDCHYNPKTQYIPQVDKIPGHLNATKYCIYCHVPNVKHKTKKQIDQYLAALHHNTTWAKEGKCSLCHKSISTENMRDCGACHGYPNPVSPSHGNVFIIHSPKGVDCQDCHGHDFILIHYYHKPFPPQFPIPTK